jgi:SAM-dependent methyltransferase
MQMRYDRLTGIAVARLVTAHDPKIAKVRDSFFQSENAFFRQHIRGQTVLVAGSGLGHDSFELARYNKKVVGIEILGDLVGISRTRIPKNLVNVNFWEGDFITYDFSHRDFDVAVLNMGTISDFNVKQQIDCINNLANAAKVVYLDFYPPGRDGLRTRVKMYQEEGWVNVRVDSTILVSSDGLYSKSIWIPEMTGLVKKAGCKVKYHDFCDFATMAEIRRG